MRYIKLSEPEEIKTQKILRDKQTEIKTHKRLRGKQTEVNTEMIRRECGREKARKGQNGSDRVITR